MSRLTTSPGVVSKASNYFLGVEEVMRYLGCKQSKAYSVIRAMNKELVEANRLFPGIPQGKVPKKYFLERFMIEEA